MEEEEPQLEVLHVADSIGSPLEDRDLVVAAFERSG